MPQDRDPRETVYELHISLRYSEPLIWRSVQVTADTTLGDLHTIIQIVMEWYEEHLHDFEIRGGGSPFAHRRGDAWATELELDEETVTLADLGLNAKVKFTYTYDFGDSWVHEIRRKKILRRKNDVQYPVCVDGARAAPPEDCGGMWGYQEGLEILSDPDDEDYEWVHDWMGDWDPERFDLDEINERLGQVFPGA